MEANIEGSFEELSLSKEVLEGLNSVGYEHPSPIQTQAIPHVLAGRDILGQAQTGTGKTAAFALPILSNLDIKQKNPQTLVLAPTRELAIQVSEAFQKYASKMPGFHVQAIYGGQNYNIQLKSLKRGVHVVVGTPGRVMDHIRRGTLNLDGLSHLVLDEADEMLQMGFLEDVKWILEQLPEKRQISLFSATVPPAIKKIADKYLKNPEHITVQSKTVTADTVRQRYWMVKNIHKLDALTRMLEAESFDAALIFVRTKSATLELAEKLKARGFAAEALNGDIVQNQREKIVNQLKKGILDIIVATDVAARGLDVPRISHVINYDVPFDTESYIHRIGRTGRAGKKGDAILFVSPREQRMLRSIERVSKSTIERMELPTKKEVADKRREEFKAQITSTLEANELGIYASVVEEYVHENEVSYERVAAALAKLAQGDRSLVIEDRPAEPFVNEESEGRSERKRGDRQRRTDKKRFDSKPRRSRDNKEKSRGPKSGGSNKRHEGPKKKHRKGAEGKFRKKAANS